MFFGDIADSFQFSCAINLLMAANYLLDQRGPTARHPYDKYGFFAIQAEVVARVKIFSVQQLHFNSHMFYVVVIIKFKAVALLRLANMPYRRAMPNWRQRVRFLLREVDRLSVPVLK